MIEVKRDCEDVFFRNKFVKDKKNILSDNKFINRYEKQRIKSLLNEQLSDKGIEYMLLKEQLEHD